MIGDSKDEKSGWVLIVEDDEDCSDALSEILVKEGYQVISAKTPQDARAKLFRQTFKGVLLDLKLGQQNGEQVVSYMRTLRGVNDLTPVLVVSGTVDGPSIDRLRPMVQGFLVKPYSSDQFIKRFKAALQTQVTIQKKTVIP